MRNKEIKEMIPHMIASKIPLNKSTKEGKDLHNKNLKIQRMTLRKTLENEKIFLCSWKRRLNGVEIVIVLKSIHRINAILINILKFMWKQKRP